MSKITTVQLPRTARGNDPNDHRDDATYLDASRPVTNVEKAKSQGFKRRDLHDDGIHSTVNEDALALAFVNNMLIEASEVPQLRYVEAWHCWMRWTGAHWERDEVLTTFDCVRAFLRETSKSSEKENQRTLGKAATVAAIERLARSDPRCASRTSDWDHDLMLLNTPGGTVNLRTGIIRPHSACEFITKITRVGPGGQCPRWMQFLSEITAGDIELQTYLQRMIGYAITGLTNEHALFFLFGTGGNGKGVFLNTLAWLLADYAKIAPMETFTASNSDRHPTEIAMLQGARLVIAQETEEGRRWAESRIKAMTGGDAITARFMHGNFFTYDPQFALLIAGNHKPALRGVDEAMRRRLHLVPFTVTIPPAQRDPALAEALKAEGPGILQWAINGCLAWQREGLNPPRAVRDATTAYFETQNAIAAWIEDCCEVGPNFWDLPAALFNSWTQWAEKAGEFVGNLRAFGDRLESEGYPRRKANGVRRHQGLALRDRNFVGNKFD